MSNLSTSNQMRYLIEWFMEWSDLQRSDFLPVLAENYRHKAYVNGIVNSISNIDFRDKPMSLFECRMKLFREWFPQWNIETKEAFFQRISQIDPDFMEKLNGEVKDTDGPVANGTDEHHE